MYGRPNGCIDQLTLVERAAIVTLHNIGYTKSEIAEEIHCSDKSVLLWIERWENEHSLVDSDRSGRPRCTDEMTDQAIEEVAEKKIFTVPKSIKNELQLECSARTIRRRLDEVGLYGRVSQTEYVYDERDIQRRLSFAEGYSKWTVADWERVIFSDETHIEVYGRSRVWVQRPVGKAYDPQYMCNRAPHSDRVSRAGMLLCKGSRTS
jgi:transposase